MFSSLFSITAPSEPLNLQAFCNVIVWKKPNATNGKITGYEVMFTFLSDGTNNTITVEGDTTHYVIAIPIPPGEMRIEVL